MTPRNKIFFLCRLDPILHHGLPLRGFAITLTGQITLVGLLWTSDQTDTETSTRQHTSFTRDRLQCPRRNSNLSSQQTRGSRPSSFTARHQEV